MQTMTLGTHQPTTQNQKETAHGGMESRFPDWPDAMSEERPSKSVVKTQNLGLAEFTEDGVNRVEGSVDFLSNLTRK